MHKESIHRYRMENQRATFIASLRVRARSAIRLLSQRLSILSWRSLKQGAVPSGSSESCIRMMMVTSRTA